MSDLINRQEAIVHLKNRLLETAINNVGFQVMADSVFTDIAYYRIESWLSEIPSAQPERKKGKWVLFSPKSHLCSCSLCGQWADRHWNFCPYCGARMGE